MLSWQGGIDGVATAGITGSERDDPGGTFRDAATHIICPSFVTVLPKSKGQMWKQCDTVLETR